MNLWSIIAFSAFLAFAMASAMADARSGYSAAPLSSGERILARIFGFFGIGAVPPMLALAVFFSTGAIAGAALDMIASLYFGADYPAWFPADAIASGLGIGLLCTRILAASTPPPSESMDVYPREAGYSF